MRLEASLKAAGDKKKLVFLHYPPLFQSYRCEEILELLKSCRSACAATAIYTAKAAHMHSTAGATGQSSGLCRQILWILPREAAILGFIK